MEDLRAKIEAAFDNLINARKRLLEDKESAIGAKEELKAQESALISSGDYTASGKNEKEREAWLRSKTENRRSELAITERDERASTLALEYALDARRNLESMLRIEELEAV
jgi:hypothetical protein